MVAVFTGTGLGVFNSSLTQLGGASGGAGGVGQSGERQYVNLATGNLVLQDIDESILTRGLPISMLRTYNSQGTVAGQGQDGWMSAFDRRVGNLTGTANTAGSTLTRYLADGSQALFVYDIGRARYVSAVGDGVHDEIVWNVSAGTALWMDLNTKVREQYDAAGRLIMVGSLETAVNYNLSYDAAGRLFSIVSNVSANGDGLFLAYDDASGRLIAVVSRENGQAYGQVWYDYDIHGRLKSVTTDLAPDAAQIDETNKTIQLPARTGTNAWDDVVVANNNGRLFRTVYTYESASDAQNLRIVGVGFSDGVSLSIQYEGGKVSRTILGDGVDAQITDYVYGVEGPSTGLSWVEVKDGSARSWKYGFDGATNELRTIVSPQVDGLSDVTTYAYDGQGNLVQAKVERGATLVSRVDYEYDAMGNAVKEWDLLGNRIDRVYNTLGLLLNETRYTTADPDGAGGSASPSASNAMTTRYAYSGVRLTHAVTANGEVTEYVYGTGSDATGGLGARFQVISVKRYVGLSHESLYDVFNLGINDPVDAYAIWQWTQDKAANVERTDYRYDVQGRLQEKRAYAQVAQTAGSGVAVGDGVLDAATEITRFSYDAQGLLRQQITQRGAGRTLGGTPANESEVVDYNYDGMGRLLTVLKRGYGTAAMPDERIDAVGYANWVAANDATTVLTTYVYTDSGNSLKVISDTGMTRTEVRNANGQVVAVTEANAPSSPSVTRTTQFHYDAAGRLIADEDASGGRRFYLYDEKGRLKATIDATGAVMETVYDGMDRVVETRRYANRVTPQASWWTAVPPTVLWRSDAGTPPGGALVVTVDATRDQVTQSTYDGAGRLATATVVGANDAQTLRTTYSYDGAGRLIQTTVSDGANTAATARTTRYLYDKAGRQTGVIDPEGYLLESQYDLAGRVVKVVRYGFPAVVAYGSNITINDVRPAMGSDLVTLYFYDGRGNQIGEYDAEGYLTEFVYDEAGNQRATKRYSVKPASITGDDWMTVLRGGTRALDVLRNYATTGLPQGTGYRLTQRSFNALGQVTVEANHEGTVTQYSYDEAGRLVKTSTGNAGEQIRDGHLRYDAFGNLIGELAGEGAALLLPTMTQPQIDALYAQYGVRHSYDLVGRRTESIDAAGNKTWYFHDADGRQTFVVRGVHDSANLQNARGEVTETRYDAFGQVLDSIAYTGAITIPVPGDRESVKATLATLAFAAASDSRTQLAYDRRGLLTQRIDAEGYRTTYAYNAFGEQTVRQDWELVDGTPGNSVRLTTDTVYDKRGQATSTTQSGGTLTRTTSATYDAFGRAITLTDARGVMRTLSYDRLGRQVGQSLDLGGGRIEAVATSYDAYSRVTTQTDALGRVTTYAYSDTNRTMTVTTPEGVAITTVHDRFGQTVEVRQPLPDGTTATTVTAYDRNGDVVSVTDALGRVSTNAYDARGLLISSTDASGRTVAYEYDAVGRVLKRREDPNGLNLTTTYAYDGQGRQVRVTDASGRTTTMAYDRRGQLTETVRDPQVNGVGLALKTTYTWDRDGRQLTVTEGAGTANATTVAYGYDALGRRTTETSAPGTLNLTTTYAYDANDNVTTKTDASGRVTRYAYDAANRLRYVVDGMGGVTESVYDLAGRATLVRTYAKPLDLTGLSLAPTEAELSTRVTSQTLANDAKDEASYRVYDKDGRQRYVIDNRGSVAETVYDAAGRSIAVRRHSVLIPAHGDYTASQVAQALLDAKTPTWQTAFDALPAAGLDTTQVGAYGNGLVLQNGRLVFTPSNHTIGYVPSIGSTQAHALSAGVVYRGEVSTGADLSNTFLYFSVQNETTNVPTSTLRRVAAYFGNGTLYKVESAANGDNINTAVGTLATDTTYVVEADVHEGKIEYFVYVKGSARDSGFRFEVDASSEEWGTPARLQVYSYVAPGLSGNALYLDNLSETVTATGQETYRYDAAGQLVAKIDALGHAETYTYDAAGRRLSATDASGRTVRAIYDAAGRQVYAIDADGGVTRTWYDAAGRTTAVRSYVLPIATAGLGDATTIAQIEALDVESAADQVQYVAYDGAGRARFQWNSLGEITEIAYDEAGRATMSRRYAASADIGGFGAAPTASDLENAIANQSLRNDALDEMTYTIHDAAGRVVAMVDGTGGVIQRSYDGAGRILHEVRHAATLSLTTTLRGNLANGSATLGDLGIGVSASDIATRHVYDASGRLTFSVDGTGAYVRRWYDAVGRQTAQVRFSAPMSLAGLGDASTVADLDLRMTWPADNETTYTMYDASGRASYTLQLTSPTSAMLRTAGYDAAGRLLHERAFAVPVAFDQALADKLVQGTATPADFEIVASASDEATRHVYDAAGRLTFSVDGRGGYVRRWYDAAGRQTAQVRFATPMSLDGLGDASTVADLDTRMTWPAENETSYTVYDAAGRAGYTVRLTSPSAATVQMARYDGVGRVLQERAFTASMAFTQALADTLVQGTATDADFAGFVAANAGTAQSQRHVYDAAGREVYTIDAIGAVSRTWYDAAGRATAVRRFATPVNPATLGDATTVAALDAQLVWTAADPTEYRAYDAAGRVRVTYNSLGLVTQTDYDGAGRATVSRGHSVAYFPGATLTDKFFAGTATVADFATFAAANESTARVQSTVYDAAGRARYTLARNFGTWTVGERQYDGIGRVSADIRYGVTIAHAPGESESQVAAALNGVLSSDPAVRATQTRTTRYLYDAANRQRFVLDATSAVSEQRYDAIGRVLETRSYGNLLANGTAIDTASVAAWAQGQSLADVRRVANSYDAAGQLISRSDALGNAEIFAYDGAGRMLTRTDRAGATWTYQYDASGRRVSELGPPVAVTTFDLAGTAQTTTRSIRTRLEYDALGNLTRRIEDADTAGARTTDYVYDTRGQQIRTTLPDAGTLNLATGAIVASGVRPTVETTYDALGRAVVQKDASGRYSYKVYDALGRVAYEIDQESYVTAYGYSAYGEQTALIRYATKLQTDASAFASANWQAGQAISLAQMLATGSVVADGQSDRTIATTYNALGQKTLVQMSSVTYYKSSGYAEQGSPITTFQYNVHGDVVRENVLLEGTMDPQNGNPVWASTWRWYDAMGRNTITVDAEGYVTAMTYNATGEVVKTVEHARATAVASLDVAVPPALPAPGDAVVGFDRETRVAYDALGRKSSETVVRQFQRTDGSSGQRDVITSYGYDGEDRVTMVAGETGTTTTTYGLDGRMLGVREQARDAVTLASQGALEANLSNTLTSAALYEARSPYTAMHYDAFGAVVMTRRYANGMIGETAAVESAQDQVSYTRYDGRGRAVWERDAEGNATVRAYDASDRLIEAQTTLSGNDGRSADVRAIVTYDHIGRQTSMRTERTQRLNGTVQSVSDDTQESVVYNAFGEIVAKTHAGIAGTLSYVYDAAGRLVADNATGAMRYYGYNLAGHQVRESHKVRLSEGSAAIDAVTRNQTDKLGRAIAVTVPSHGTDPAQTSLIRQTFDRWGNVLTVIDGRGYQTDYQYNQDNQAVRETRPLVWVVAENGAGSWQRPVNQWYYDALGRLVGTRDANGNLRTMAYDTVGRNVSSTDALGNVTRFAYDLFGNQVMTQDALGTIAFKAFDRSNRVVAIGDYVADGSARSRQILQSYVLNEAGDRLQMTDRMGRTQRYDYDSQQRMIRSQTASGTFMEYAYDVAGRKVSETSQLSTGTVADRDGGNATLNALSWKYDVFGRIVDHNLLSGRDYDYVYDTESGQLMRESIAGGAGLANATGGHKTYTYFVNGRVHTVKEYVDSMVGTPGTTPISTHVYQYDAGGNRIYEETTTKDGQDMTVHTVTRTTYDSNNRVQRVTQDDLNEAGAITKRVFELQYDYDANGNRRRVVTLSGYGPNVTGIALVDADPTLVAPVADRGVKKGQVNQFRLLFSDVFRDPENDALTLTIARGDGGALPSWLQATRDPQTGEIVFTSTAAANAQDADVVVRLTASQTGDAAKVATTTFTVRLRENNAPTLISSSAIGFDAVVGQPFGRDLSAADLFRDIDANDTLSLSVVGTNWPSWLTANTQAPGTLRLSGTPTAVGTYTFTVRATDQSGVSVDKTVTITNVVNHAPTVPAAPAPVVAKVGKSFSWLRPLSQVFSDLDGDTLQVTATGLPAWLSFQSVTDGAAPELRIQGLVPPTEPDAIVYTVVLKATDKYGATATTALQITTDGNLAPVAIGSVNLPALRINDTLNYTAPISSLFSDPDGDLMTLYVEPPAFSPLFSWIRFEMDQAAGTIRIYGQPLSPLTIGTFPFKLKAVDANGAVGEITVNVSVAADTAPVRNTAVALNDATLSIGRSFSYTLPANLFTDADGDPLTLSIAGVKQGQEQIEIGDGEFELRYVVLDDPLPTWLHYDAGTRTFWGSVPATETVRSLIVRVGVTDSRGLSNATSDAWVGNAGVSNDADFRFTLQPWTNSAPQYTPNKLGNHTLVHGGAVDLLLPSGSFVEPDGEALTYSAQVQIGGSWVDIGQIGLAINASTGRITGTAVNLVGSTINARIIATDPQGATGTGTFAFTVTNTAPTVGTIPAQQVGRNASWSFALSSYFSDVNSDALTYGATGLPAGLTLNTSTGAISGQATAALGSYTVNVSASDGRGGSASTSFSVQVVNSAPVAPSVSNQTATAGTAWSWQAPAFTDPNGDPLTYSATGLPGWMSFNATTRTFSGNAAAVGSWAITFTATDPAGVSTSVGFTVSTPNVAPTATTIPAQSVGRNAAWSFGTSGYFADANGDALSYSASGLPSGLSINSTTGTISGTATVLGSHTVTVTVADGRGGTANAVFTLAVTNSAPVSAIALPNRSAQVGGAVSWSMTANSFTDANGDALTYALWVEIPAHTTLVWNPLAGEDGEWEDQNVAAQWVAGSSAGLSIAANGTISGNLGALSADGQTFYNYRSKVVASDPAGATAEGIFNISANVAPTAPSVTAPLAKQNQAYSLTLPVFTDANGDALSYSVSNLPAGLSFNATTRTISGTPTGSGAATVTYSANDGMGGTASMTFTLTVEANTAPVAPSVGTQSGATGAAVYVTLPAFTDANYDTLSYSVGNLPTGLSFNASTRVISGTPTAVGNWTVSYSATDGRGGTASTTFAFAISAPVSNQPPIVANAIPDQYSMAGTYYSYAFPANTFLDPEGATLSYTATKSDGSALPTWLSFNAATRTFSGTPTGTALMQSWTIRVTATDNQGQSVFDDFVLVKDIVEEGQSVGGGEEMLGGIGGEETQGGGGYTYEMGTGEESGTTSSTPAGVPVQVQERWFTYDAENRLKIVNGQLVGTAGDANARIELRPDSLEEVPQGTQKEVSDSYGLMYDAIGRETGRYQRTTVNGVVQDQVAFVGYDQRGNRIYETYAQAVGGESKGIYRLNKYDDANQLIDTRRFFELGTIRQVWVAPIDRYGGDQPPPEGSEDWVPEDVNVGGWLMQSEQYAYDIDGRMRWQETRGRETNFKYYQGAGGGGDQYNNVDLLQFTSRVDYTIADNTANVDDNASAYDLGGRLLSYRYSGTGPGAAGGYTHTFTMTYEGWESWQERIVTGESSHNDYKSTTNTISLDSYGRITQQSEHTNTDQPGVFDKIRAYAYNGDGAVLNRRDGYWDGYFRQATKPASNGDPIPQNYRFVQAAGQQLAELEAGGEVRVKPPSGNARQMAMQEAWQAVFNPQTNKLSKVNGTAGAGVYSAGGSMVTVIEGETLQNLAQRIYGNASLWYVLADANGYSDATTPLTSGTRLNAPSVSVSKNDANTFRPYNPNEPIGSTTPSLPYIPPVKGPGCNMVAMILLVVIAIVVTVFTAGAAAGALAATQGAVAGAAGTTMAVGGAAMTGAVIGVTAGGATITLTAAGTMAVAAVAGAAGAAVSMAVGSVMGVSSFSWRQVAASGLTAGITAGIGNSSWLGAIAKGAKYGHVARAAVSAGLGSVASYAANKAVGVENAHFSWRNVAASAITAAATSYVSPFLSDKLGFDLSTSSGQAQSRMLSGVIGGVTGIHVRRGLGLSDQVDYSSVTADVVGSLIGDSMTGEYARSANDVREAEEKDGTLMTEQEINDLLAGYRSRAEQEGQPQEVINNMPKNLSELQEMYGQVALADRSASVELEASILEREKALSYSYLSDSAWGYVKPVGVNGMSDGAPIIGWSSSETKGWGPRPTQDEIDNANNMGWKGRLKFYGGMFIGVFGSLGDDVVNLAKGAYAFNKFVNEGTRELLEVRYLELTNQTDTKRYYRARDSLDKKFDTLTTIAQNVPQIWTAIKNIPRAYIEEIQSDFRGYRRSLQQKDFYSAGIGGGILAYKTLGLVLGGYGLAKGGIAIARTGGDVLADIVSFVKDLRVREVEIPWASGVPDLDDLPSQINDVPISSKPKPSSSPSPAPVVPSSRGTITDRLPEVVVSRSDIDIEITPYEGGVHKEYSVVIDGKVHELGYANLSETGKVDAGIFFKRKINGIETRIRIEDTRATDFVLEDAIATFESRYGRKPSNLGGSIAADNLANFQREFYQIRRQNPAMGEYEIAATATRRISYGAARDRLGYSDFRFNGGNGFSYGDVFIDGILYRNVPKKVSIDAYRPKR
jgi:YD repeat-containing protein